MTILTEETLSIEAKQFSATESKHQEQSLFGVTDGKAIGTYLEHKFTKYLTELGYIFEAGNSANGIDFPGLKIDMKVTSAKQPQSSCPYKSGRQKIFGLGYGLIIFVYEKFDNPENRTATLHIRHTVFVQAHRTADFQMTKGLLNILHNEGNRDDLVAFMSDKNLPVDEIVMNKIADEIILKPPLQGYLTVSNALQWRLHYGHVIKQAGVVDGVNSIHKDA